MGLGSVRGLLWGWAASGCIFCVSQECVISHQSSAGRQLAGNFPGMITEPPPMFSALRPPPPHMQRTQQDQRDDLLIVSIPMVLGTEVF